VIVQPPQLAALDWAAAAAGTLAKPWKVGSIVSGRVLEYLPGLRLVLQINGLKVEADPPSGGSVPPQFQARVLANGPPPVLELLSQTQRSENSPVAAALRARLPRQDGLQPLLSDLRALARTPGARALPEPVRLALARLEGSIADRHDLLDADVLRDTLQRSGLQLEHTLRQRAEAPAETPTAHVDYDLKAALERLVQTLQRLPRTHSPAAANAPREPLPAAATGDAPQPSVATILPPLLEPIEPPPLASIAAPPPFAKTANPPPPAEAAGEPVATGKPADPSPPPLLRLPLQPQSRLPATLASDVPALAAGMLKHAEAALSRIEIMQLEAHPSASPQACMLEVPVRDGEGFDVLQVRIEQDAEAAQAAAEPNWTLGFTLDPPGLGPVHGQIHLRGAQVNVDLWAQHDAGVAALEEQTSVLSRLLAGSGLQLGQLRVRQGTPLRHTGLGRTLLEALA
jgi:flagellar hook-length control protein FliK